MKRTTFVPALQIAGLALAALSMSGCSKNEINLIVDKYSGQVILNPVKGQTINWVTADQSFKAHFTFVGPCQEGLAANPCTVNVDQGIFIYECPGCQDPVVVVGSSGQLEQFKSSGGQVTAQVGPQVALNCQSDIIAIGPDPVTGAAPQGIQWRAVGDTSQPKFLKTWTITFTTDICEKSVDQSQPVCQIRKDAPSGSYPYAVKSPDCTKPGNGTVTIPPR